MEDGDEILMFQSLLVDHLEILGVKGESQQVEGGQLNDVKKQTLKLSIHTIIIIHYTIQLASSFSIMIQVCIMYYKSGNLYSL